jgi:hypothetical protein
MPTSLAGLVLFVVLLTPGMVYVRRRERQQAAMPVSALRETTTIVLASVACELLVAGLLGLARVAWPADTPDVGALVRDPAGAVRTEYAALVLWGAGLVAAASVVALAGAAVNLPARIGQLVRRVRWLAWLLVPPTGEITPSFGVGQVSGHRGAPAAPEAGDGGGAGHARPGRRGGGRCGPPAGGRGSGPARRGG